MGVALLLVLGWAELVAASPWVLKAGQLVVVGRYDFESADEEFLDDRESQVFPLRGQYRAATFTTSLRYGVLDGLEVELILPIKQVSYTSDPVLLLPTDDFDTAFDFYQENIIDLSRSVVGLGDIQLASRYQLFERLVRGALELRLKTPTGYNRPAGTFGERPESREAFLAEIDRFVAPENVRDDVTLGDGQLDLSPALLLGVATPFGAFARMDLGYRLRFGGAGDQIFGGFRLGMGIGQRLLVYGGVDVEYAVQEGRVIGVSVAAEDPTLPAAEYGGTENLNLREVTLDRDALSIQGGVIFRATRAVEFNLGYGETVWGRNTARVSAFSIGVGLRTSLIP